MRIFPWIFITSFAITTFSQDIPRYGIFEHTINHSSGGYDNVWEDVTIDVQITSPTGKNYSIGGFFYDEDTWKFRFRPNETGTWQYAYTINGGAETTGEFQVIDSDAPGYLHKNPHNPRRWVFDNGEPFYIFGVQDCLEFKKWEFNQLGKGNWRISDRQDLTFEAFTDSLKNTGFNLIRLNNGNCSPSFTGNLKVMSEGGNEYSKKGSLLMDQYADIIFQKGFRIYMPIFGMDLPWTRIKDPLPEPDQIEAIKRFITYAVNRYSAYVDIWEVGNEVQSKEYKDTLIKVMDEHLRSVTPYQPAYVSMSWERPDLDFLDIISPHDYTKRSPEKFNKGYVNEADEWRHLNKPIIYGEVGNSSCSYDTLYNSFRWRVNTWTMFFVESAPIFWHQWNRTYCGGASNLYVDPELKTYFQYYTAWREGFDVTANRTEATPSTDDVQVFAQSGQANYALYIYDNTGYQSTRSDLSVTISPNDAAQGSWFDPKTGVEIAQVNVPQGEQEIEVPPFQADIVLKLTMEGATSLQRADRLGQTKNATQFQGSGFSINGRRITPDPRKPVEIGFGEQHQ